jgi:hypothetical protein
MDKVKRHYNTTKEFELYLILLARVNTLGIKKIDSIMETITPDSYEAEMQDSGISYSRFLEIWHDVRSDNIDHKHVTITGSNG